MSLSHAIIYGSIREVESLVTQHPINEIDEYGYTPLVQCAIVSSAEKAEILLKAGALVDMPDLTGRTALHWAVDNNNEDLCRLLLQHGANANAYTVSGQPVLVTPLLRHHHETKNLLYRHHANLDFAQDFINTKLLGHRYNLIGRADILNEKNELIEIEFEGFYLEFTLPVILHSLQEFQRHFHFRAFHHYHHLLERIIHIFSNACELLQYQHYLVEKKKKEKRINHLLTQPMALLPIAYQGHGIGFILYQHLLMRCDRGEFGRKHGTMILYQANQPQLMTPALWKSLLYKRQNAKVINEDLIKRIDATPIMQIPMSAQVSGNCSWANMEAAVLGMLFLLIQEQQQTHGQADVADAQKQALSFYNAWLAWDRERALFFCWDSFSKSNEARKATKAALMTAILFQCYRGKQAQEFLWTDRILKIITHAKYNYILRAYLKVFLRENNTTAGKNLVHLLEDYGVRPDQLD